jgi:hypothetical protein
VKFKKIVSLLLTAVLTISMLAVPAFASTTTNDSDFTIVNGVITAYNGSGGNITIPSSVTSSTSTVPTTVAGTVYYYCIVINTVGTSTATTTSSIAKVVVKVS